MTNRSPFGMSFALTCAGLGALLAASACGGSARSEGVSTSAAGASGQTSAAGAPGSAGSGCENVNCSTVSCGADEVRVHDACCDSCAAGGATGGAGAPAGGSAGALNCENASCDLSCPAGEFAEPTPDRCCPVCMPESAACVKGQAGYEELFGQLFSQPSATSCVLDSDCQTLPSFPQCGSLCPTTPVSVAQASTITEALNQWQNKNCSTCPEILLPCPAPPEPVCVRGQCLAYHPL